MSLATLITGVAIGGISGYLVSRYKKYRAKAALSTEYFQGLNYLLNEEQDKAIEVLSRLVEADQETLDVQMALGNLFRRRGEVERAIHIHQHLAARDDLDAAIKTKALFELGEDYMRAGLLDRAEALYTDLADISTHAAEALANLITIYQRESEWHEAIKYSHKLEEQTGKTQALPIAQFYCELAEQALVYGASHDAARYLDTAFHTHPDCIRAWLLQGRMLQDAHDYAKAIQSYETAIIKAPTCAPDVLPHLMHCYAANHAQQQGYAFLCGVLETYDGISVVLALTELKQVLHSHAQAVDFLSEHLDDHPSVRGTIALLDMTIDQTSGDVFRNFQMLRRLAQKLLERQARYRCAHCGFGARAHHWQCPGCKQWSSIQAIRGVAHE